MCERPALLLKMSVTLERDMTEKRRRKNEEGRINQAKVAAERFAKQYLLTDKGQLMIRQQAECCLRKAATGGGYEDDHERTHVPSKTFDPMVK